MGPLQAQALLAQRRSSREDPKSSSGAKADPVMKIENLEELLKEIGLEKYYPLFQLRGVEINQFSGLTDQDLKDLVFGNLAQIMILVFLNNHFKTQHYEVLNLTKTTQLCGKTRTFYILNTFTK